MPCTVTGPLSSLTAAGSVLSIAAGTRVYAYPSRNDIHVSISSVWYAWSTNPGALPATYSHAVTTQLVSSGFSFVLPFTDTEVYQADSEPVTWIIDLGPGGVWTGALPASVGASATLKTLVTSHGWTALTPGFARGSVRVSEPMVGSKNGSNTVFTVRAGETYQRSIPGANIAPYLNGCRLIEGVDFTASESGGVGTGYDTITFITASEAPGISDSLICDYTVA